MIKHALCAGAKNKDTVSLLLQTPLIFILFRLDDVLGEGAGLKLKEKLLTQEKELLATQNDWLSQELECKSDQLIQLRKERSSTVGELESQLATRDEEV